MRLQLGACDLVEERNERGPRSTLKSDRDVVAGKHLSFSPAIRAARKGEERPSERARSHASVVLAAVRLVGEPITSGGPRTPASGIGIRVKT